ncbi:MAG: hypothetical protein NTX79_01385 [Candidatus Micrarchaeota archaeon]|nr:hypothetical protein [Candidatus Micrarchaeota archaeon]
MRHHILAIFAVSVLLLSGCAQQPGPVVTPEPVVTPTPVPANNTALPSPCSAGNIVQNDICFASLALEKSNSSYCRDIYAIDKLDSCLYHFANDSLDICKQITSADLRFSCLTANAVREKSESICNLIDNTDAAAACLQKVLPPCMLISGESARSLCIALDKNDFSLCKDDACLAGFALNRSSEVACGAITRQNDRYYCLALVGKSVASCLDAPIVPVQDSCIMQASEALGDVSGCSLATSEGTYQNDCYLYFAVARGNATICQMVSSETNRDACYKNYSIGTATVGACPKVVESSNRADCYLKSAKLNRMPSLCNPLWTNDLKNICYPGAILYPAEGPLPSDCPGVSSTDWRDKCYYQAARATYNGTLCGLMSEGASDRKNCESLFN